MHILLNKRLLVLAFAIAITTSLVVACGGDDDESATDAPTSAATIEASTGAAVETATPKPASASATATPEAADPTDEPSGLAGTWSGTYESTSDPRSNGTFVLDWTQSGSALSGTINVASSECVSEGTITGTTDGSTITFGAVEGTFSIAYEGTVSGDSMSGTYSSPSCGNATGTWQAAKQ